MGRPTGYLLSALSGRNGPVGWGVEICVTVGIGTLLGSGKVPDPMPETPHRPGAPSPDGLKLKGNPMVCRLAQVVLWH